MPLAGTVESALTWGWTDPLTVAAAMFTAAFLWRGAFTNVQTTRTHLIVRNALWTHRVLWSDVREIGFPDDEPGAKLTVRRMHGRDIRASGVRAPSAARQDSKADSVVESLVEHLGRPLPPGHGDEKSTAEPSPKGDAHGSDSSRPRQLAMLAVLWAIALLNVALFVRDAPYVLLVLPGLIIWSLLTLWTSRREPSLESRHPNGR